jgi:hypothetical protein
MKSPASYYKSSTHHLSFVKEKLSTIIHALSLQDSGTAEHELGMGGGNLSGGVLSLGIGASWIDSLGLILGCGTDERSEVRPSLKFSSHLFQSSTLSSLIPNLSGGLDEQGFHEANRTGKLDEMSSTSLPCGDVIDWIESHIRLNEFLYPPCPMSSNHFSSPPSTIMSPRVADTASDSMALEGEVPVDFNSGSGQNVPRRQTVSLSSLQAREPLVVNGTAHTFIHLLTVDSTNTSTIPPTRLRTVSGEGTATSPTDPLGITTSMEDLSEAKGQLKEPHSKHQQQSPSSPLQLGTGLIHNCVRMTIYLLSPVTCLTITSCVDCEIVVGAVSGVILMSGCERVHLTTTCRKLIVWNSHDCDIRLATLTPSIVSGDCRGLVFGPFNTAYRLLRSHMRLAHLENLITSSHISIGINYWSEIYDVSTCLDAPPQISPPTSAPSSPRSQNHNSISGGSSTFLSMGSGSGSGMGSPYSSNESRGSLSSGLSSLPKPHESVLTLLNPEKYSFLSIPYPPEYQPSEVTLFPPLPLPPHRPYPLLTSPVSDVSHPYA